MTCEPKKEITIKTGTSGLFHLIYTDVDGTPISLLDHEDIQVKFTNPKTKIILFLAKLDNGLTLLEQEYLDTNDDYTGQYIIDAGDTTDWPLGTMPVDIKYMKNGYQQYSETFYLNFIKGIS